VSKSASTAPARESVKKFCSTFKNLIADDEYASLNFTVKRENMEEINLQGPLGNTDIRIIIPEQGPMRLQEK